MTAEPTPTSPLVSILLPVYNGARFLDTTLGCLVAQTWSDFEIIACDDASTDNSWEKLQEWSARDLRIRLLRHQVNQGVQKTQKELAAAARGELIAQQDQDDYSAPERLETQVKLLQTHPEAVGTVSNVWLLDENGDPIGITSIPGTAEELKAAMRHANVCWHSTLLMRKSAFEQTGGYRQEADHVADYDMLLRLLKIGPIIPSEKPLATYGLSPGTVTYRDRATQVALAQCIRHTHFGDPKPDQIFHEPLGQDEARANYHLEVGRMYLAKGKHGKARENLLAALKDRPLLKTRLLVLLTYAPASVIQFVKHLKQSGGLKQVEPEYFLRRNR